MVAPRPVGIFDSGVGGLSVLRAMRDELPHEPFLYVADSRCAPYGNRTPAFITERAVTISEFLIDQGAKALVVACNTATAAAVDALRARYTIPIVAIEPAVKPAAQRSRAHVVGVLATESTISSSKMGKLLVHNAEAATILVQPCPGLAEQVERGELESDATRALVAKYVRPIVDKGADTLVLGCTHYPFLRALIQEAAGAGVELIDPATAVARELRRRLERESELADDHTPGGERFWTTGTVDAVAPVVRKLWGKPVELQRLAR